MDVGLKHTAGNGQFAKMAALSRPKLCLNLQPSSESVVCKQYILLIIFHQTKY